MNNLDFAKRMRMAPDEELFAVVSSDGFVGEAVEAAKAEIQRRKIEPGEIDRINDQIHEQSKSEEARTTIGLSTAGKLGFLVFGGSPVGIAAALVLRARGYRQKAKEALTWIAVSFTFWVTLGFVIR